MACRFLPASVRMPRVAVARQPARVLTAALTLAAVLASKPSSAAEQGFNEYEFTPLIGYTFGGEFEDPADSSDRDLDEGTSYGLIFNLAADEWRHYEVLFSSQSTAVQGVVPFDMDIQYLQIGGTVSSPDAERVIPYFGMTVGGALLSPDLAGLDDEAKIAFSVGGGMKIPITDHIGIRFDVRTYITLLDTDSDIFCVSTGGTGTCRIRAKSDTFLQYSASLGVTIGF
jgi:opacity protein-like surface antigen